MQIIEIKEPIAQRKLTANGELLLVTIGKLALFEDQNDYYCPYSIEYAGQRKFSYAAGTDAVQALQLALKKVGVDLVELARKRNIQISWMDDMPGETGFPL